MYNNRDPLQVIIKVNAPDGMHDNLIGTIRPLLGSIRSLPGCLECHVYQDAEHREEMALLQEWESESAFARHVGSRDYRYILEWMEMSASKPTVTVSREMNRRGLEIIENLRQIK